MKIATVSSKGQITIPKELRQEMGIRQGSRMEFMRVGDHLELRVWSSLMDLPGTGFGMLKTRRKTVPADFDPAALPKR
jgi:AbrB family looped-hinge helix DNA binding protein